MAGPGRAVSLARVVVGERSTGQGVWRGEKRDAGQVQGSGRRRRRDRYGRHHVDRAEKLRAPAQVVALAGLRGSANDNSVALLTRRPAAGDLSPFGGEVKIPPPSGGSGG